VTTNSESGIESYTAYYPVFEAMQQVDMVLNIHGEIPSDPGTVSGNRSFTPLDLVPYLTPLNAPRL
jgi:dihydroorotase